MCCKSTISPSLSPTQPKLRRAYPLESLGGYHLSSIGLTSVVADRLFIISFSVSHAPQHGWVQALALDSMPIRHKTLEALLITSGKINR